jgi:cytochrome P450
MTSNENQLWQRGSSDAPQPPFIRPGISSNPERFIVDQYRTLGPVFRLPRPDGKVLVVLAGPEANVFSARYGEEFFTTKERWEEFDEALGNRGMSRARDGEANKQRRQWMSRSYSRARVLDQLPRMLAITSEFSQWQVGERIEVLSALQRMVAEQLGQLLVGHGPGEYLRDFVTFLNISINATMVGSAQGREALQSEEYLHAKERAYELGRKILVEHLAEERAQGKPDLVDDMLAEAKKHPEVYGDETLERAGWGPLLAGLDTVANTTSFMLYALLKNPEVLERVRTEVDTVLGTGELDWEKLKRMDALHGAAMETLRLYPVAGAHMARAVEPFTFAGYRLEKGDDVMVAMTVPHFLEEFYPEPERFDIDRYTDPRNEHRQRGAYAPFSLGDHTCLGAGIAELQIMVITASLLHRYDLAMDPADYKLHIENEPTASPGKGFGMKVLGVRGV